jgi:hypothetical protein
MVWGEAPGAKPSGKNFYTDICRNAGDAVDLKGAFQLQL